MKRFVRFIIILIVLIVLVVLYARYLGTKGLEVREYKLESSTITDSYHGLKIVHLSDVHYGSIIFEEELSNIVDKINLLKPDIVVLTGDLIDSDYPYDKDILIKYLSKIKATIGKYAVSGNNDIMEDYNIILGSSGFKSLDNDYELIYNSTTPIIISGISSSYSETDIGYKTEKFDTYISSLETSNRPVYSILLMHEPDFVDKLNLDNYNLILAGHSHGGQVVLPVITKWFLPKGSEKYYKAYYKINNTDLYISSGLGTDKLKLRLFDKPSINFYRLNKQ